MSASFYDFSAPSLDGGADIVGQQRGKVTVVVNVASFCGYTRQYAGLQGIHQELKVVVPTRPDGSGYGPGLTACLLLLIPYGQPIAICMFIAWMLLANNAIARLVRFHDELPGEGDD